MIILVPQPFSGKEIYIFFYSFGANSLRLACASEIQFLLSLFDEILPNQNAVACHDLFLNKGIERKERKRKICFLPKFNNHITPTMISGGNVVTKVSPEESMRSVQILSTTKDIPISYQLQRVIHTNSKDLLSTGGKIEKSRRYETKIPTVSLFFFCSTMLILKKHLLTFPS